MTADGVTCLFRYQSMWERCKKHTEKKEKDGFSCCLCPRCSLTGTRNGKKIRLADCKEQRCLQALRSSSAEKLQSTSLPLLLKILFTLSRRVKPIARGVTQKPVMLQRMGWRVYKRNEKGSLDLGHFLLSSASSTHRCITQVSTRFLSSEIRGNPQKPPWGGWHPSAPGFLREWVCCSPLSHSHMEPRANPFISSPASAHVLRTQQSRKSDVCLLTALAKDLAFEEAVSWKTEHGREHIFGGSRTV